MACDYDAGMKRSMKILGAFLAGGLLVSCAEGTPSTPTTVTETVTATATVTAEPESNPDEALLEKAIREYTAAFFTDAKSAYGLLSEKCQGARPYAEYVQVIELAKITYPDGSEIETLETTINGEKATATYSLEHSELNQTNESWIKESDGWKYNQC